MQFPLAESKDTLAFATEPITASLANLLGHVQNIDEVPAHLAGYEVHETEAALGAVELCGALQFCHADANLIHGDVTPESVFVTPRGEWKLGGFHFTSPNR